MTINKDGIVPEVPAREAEVITRNGTVGVEEIGVLGGDVLVVTDLLARKATEVLAEATQASMPLFEDDSLCFDFTDGFGDNPGSRCGMLVSCRVIGEGKREEQTSWPFLG